MKALIFMFFLGGVVFGYYAMKMWDQVDGQNPKVLSEKVEVTATPTMTPPPSPTPTLIPTPTPTIAPTPTPMPKIVPKYSPQEIHGFMERFSGQYGIDVNVLRHIAVCESGFNQLATNGPYAGLFQFNANTWITYRKQIGEDPNPDLRYDAEEATQTAAYALSKGQRRLWPNCVP